MYIVDQTAKILDIDKIEFRKRVRKGKRVSTRKSKRKIRG